VRGPFFLCILLGIFSAGLGVALEYSWNELMGSLINAHPSLVFIESFVGVGAFEELAKWLWLVFVISRWTSFDRYSTGILYACGIAGGFSLIEGGLYGWMYGDMVSIIIRGISAVPVHFLFGIIMGFLFARYKFESRRFFWPSLIVPIALHGLYDFFLFQKYADLLIGVALLVFAGCLSISVWFCLYALKSDRLRLSAE
jgi:RsiW-degrading membrane proteinase PrsW (M82 family)